MSNILSIISDQLAGEQDLGGVDEMNIINSTPHNTEEKKVHLFHKNRRKWKNENNIIRK